MEQAMTAFLGQFDTNGEVRCRRTEDRGQRTDDRKQVRGQKADDGSVSRSAYVKNYDARGNR